MESIIAFLFKLVDRFIPKKEWNGSEENIRNARIVYGAFLLIFVNDILFCTLGFIQHDRVLPWIVLICGILMGLTPLYHKYYGSLNAAGLWISGVCTAMLLSTSLLSGGMHSSSQVWFGALIVFVMVTQGSKPALILTGVIGLETLTVWWLSAHGVVFPDYENPVDKAISWSLSFSASLFLVVCILHGFFETHRHAIRNLDRQTKTLLIQTKELGQAKFEAEAASKSRSEFIATVSHEIRTPMNGILGVTQLMNGTVLSQEQQKFMHALRISAEGLLSILGDILDFSKIEAGKLEVLTEPFSLKAVCEESLSVFAGISETKNLKINFQYHNGLPNHVIGDPVRIRQVLLNLIGNAVKFTEKGVIEVNVFPLEGRKDWVKCTVKDQGIGMSEATLKILFQPYTQADASSSRKFGGTGLGLAICNRLIALMGGKISVDSQLGQGSCFSFELALLETKLPVKSSVVPVPEVKNMALPKAHVLVAEDNAVNLMVVVKMLEKLNVSIEVAHNGIEAVEHWEKGSFDLIFMDCQMPEMDGYLASQTIRAKENASKTGLRIPIVALTAHAMEEDRIRCLAAGMDAYLTKPVKSSSLGEALAAWVHDKSSLSFALKKAFEKAA